MHYAEPYTTPRERVISGAFASTMHLLFIALLVFGVNWQKKAEPQVNIVDLWSPVSEAPKLAPAPPVPEPKPEPKVEPKPEPKPAPKVEPPKPVAKPETVKPDIAFKDKEKKEKEKRAEEEKQKAADKKREEEAAAKKAQQAEAQRAKEQAEAERKVAEQAAAARASMIDKYKKGIQDKIQKFVVRPANIKGDEQVEFDIVVLPDGNVLGAKRRKPSGNEAYDTAVERAINRAQPLPLPPDPALAREFRELNLSFKPQ